MNPPRGVAGPRRAARQAMRHLLRALCPRPRGRPLFLLIAGPRRARPKSHPLIT